MEIPREIFDEIMSYILTPEPTSFHGLQIAFTCKVYYAEFQPAIARLQCRSIKQALTSRSLSIDEHGLTLGQAAGLLPKDLLPLEDRISAIFTGASSEGSPARSWRLSLEVLFTIPPHVDTTVIWCLHSLFSVHQFASRLRKVRLTFPKRQDWLECPECSNTQWHRALAKLMEKCSINRDLELMIEGRRMASRSHLSPTHHRLQAGIMWLAMSGKSRITSLHLKAQIFLPNATALRFQPDSHHASSSLTHLNLDALAVEDLSRPFLEYTFPRLIVLTIKINGISVPLFAQFLQRNTTIVSVTVMCTKESEWRVTAKGTTSIEAFIPHIRSIVGSPRFLQELLDSPYSFPNLETLTIDETDLFSCYRLPDLFDILRSVSRHTDFLRSLAFRISRMRYNMETMFNLDTDEGLSTSGFPALRYVDLLHISITDKHLQRVDPLKYVQSSLAVFFAAFPSLLYAVVHGLFSCESPLDEVEANNIAKIWAWSRTLEKLELRSLELWKPPLVLLRPKD
ncbi:hypothetical protein DFP72DRAFT_865961 [Ephemerocybe angulata]|uniref:Uncharacterized protein n=1 Tax=Ephemerocybe angulata TaxID=980116 RepID=A0A8H6IKD2_9AGAR|nr:hypothetical protein DFP72DRAFT_865961 [Tulosesus angulatus]